MSGSTTQRYIHIDDFGPVGIDNGPDDLAFAAARAALAATGYRTLVIGSGQYWLQNGFNLNAYTDANGVQYPALPNVLITSDSSVALVNTTFGITTTVDEVSSTIPVFSGLPATIVLSPGYADPAYSGTASSGGTNSAYNGGSEPCRTTGSIQLADSCSITNIRIMSLAAYQLSQAVSRGYDSAMLADQLVYGSVASMAVPVGAASGLLGVSAGGGTAIQFDGSFCSADNVVILGFRNGIVSVPLFNPQSGSLSGGSGQSPMFGLVQGDCSNLIRVDQCNNSGSYPGPISQVNCLTNSFTYSISAGAVVSDGAGGTNISWSEANFGPNGALPAVGQVFTLNITVANTGGACYNAFNVDELNPVGSPTNRYTGTITASGSAGGTLNLPGIPVTSFYDATCLTSASVSGALSGSGQTLTISSIASGAIAAGQIIPLTAGTFAPSVMIESVGFTVTGESVSAVCSLSAGGLTGTAYEILSGVSATGSISGSTLTTKPGTATLTLGMGQLITGAGVLPGTTIVSPNSVSGTSVTCTVAVPQVSGPSVFTAMSSTASSTNLTGSILGTILTLTGSPAGTGTVLSGAGVLNGSFMSGTNALGQMTVGVFQEVGSPAPVMITAIPGAVVLGGTIAPITMSNTSSLTIVGSGSALGSLATNMMLLGPGIPPNTYVLTTTGSITISGSFELTDPLTIVAVPAVGIQGSIAGQALTITEVLSPLSVSAGVVLTGSGLAPVTYHPRYAGGTISTGSKNLEVAQSVPAGTPLNVIPTATFLGSISGSILQLAPAGILPAGQRILYSSSTGTATFVDVVGLMTANTYQVTGVAHTILDGGPELMTAVSAGATLVSATFTGAIGNSVVPTPYLTASTVMGTLLLGQQITGLSIDSPTFIIGTLSGTGTYILSQSGYVPSESMLSLPPSSASFLGTASGSSLTVPVSALSFGGLFAGQALVGEGLVPGSSAAVYISGNGIISGNNFEYPISPSQTSAVTGQMAAFAAPPLFAGAVAGTTLVVTPPSALSIGSILTGSGILPQTTVLSGSLNSYIVSNFQTIGSQPNPVTIVQSSPGSVASGTGSISGTTLAFSNGESPLSIGDLVVGSGVLPNTTVVGTTAAAGTYTINVLQQVESSPLVDTVVDALVMGSISGTLLTVSSYLFDPSNTLTLSTGDVLMGPGIAFGTYISGTTTTANVYNVAVPQFVGNSTAATISAVVGECVAGSIMGTLLDVGAVSYGTLVSAQIITGPNVLSGTSVQNGSVAAGASGTVTLTVSQETSEISILALNPLSTTGSPVATLTTALTLEFAALGARPGRTLELNASNQSVIGNISGFGAGTIVRTVDSPDVRVLALNGNTNQNDLNTTAVDIQLGAAGLLLSAADVVGLYTFVNDNSQIQARANPGGVRIVGSSASLPPGGTLINQQGLQLLVSGCAFGSGSINIGSGGTISNFSATAFALGTSPTGVAESDGPPLINFYPATNWVYATGYVPPEFDPSCVNPPPT